MIKTWMGFQSSPKPIAGATKHLAELSLTSKKAMPSLFALLSTAEGLSKWLGQTAHCKTFVGEKFTSVIAKQTAESVFISITVPNRVVILNDFLGEIDLRLKKSGVQVECSVRISRATTESEFDAWQSQIDKTFSRLQNEVNHG